MAKIELPELPKHEEFEDCIVAALQANGYYTERNIKRREDSDEILELDIVSTDYDQTPPRMRLIEVKSGTWGYGDIFKIRGWLDYLNLSEGMLVYQKSRPITEVVEKVAERLSIRLVHVSSPSTLRESLVLPVRQAKADDLDIGAWRFAYWMERALLRRLKTWRKTRKDKVCFQVLEDYHRTVNDEVFFTDTIIGRAEKLYTAYMDFPRVSARTGNELAGGSFLDDVATVPHDIYTQTYYDCQYNPIQVSTFIEHRARLSILKQAVDYRLFKQKGEDSNRRFRILGLEVTLLDLLPSSFKQGLEAISTHRYFHRYPAFWQWFMWVFGGFILTDYEDEELHLLSTKTGIPQSEIPNAFQAYDLLFPISGGWLVPVGATNIRLLKMFSVPFMGLGANMRRYFHTDTHSLNDLKLGGRHTLDDLAKWANLGREVLETDMQSRTRA